jgi:hypothetical protein
MATASKVVPPAHQPEAQGPRELRGPRRAPFGRDQGLGLGLSYPPFRRLDDEPAQAEGAEKKGKRRLTDGEGEGAIGRTVGSVLSRSC